MKYRIRYAASGQVVKIEWPSVGLCAAVGDLVFAFSTLERTLREIPRFDDWHSVVQQHPPISCS